MKTIERQESHSWMIHCRILKGGATPHDYPRAYFVGAQRAGRKRRALEPSLRECESFSHNTEGEREREGQGERERERERERGYGGQQTGPRRPIAGAGRAHVVRSDETWRPTWNGVLCSPEDWGH